MFQFCQTDWLFNIIVPNIAFRYLCAKLIIVPGIYIHIPFCKRKCMYCDFYSVARSDKTDEFIDALLLEAEMQNDYFGESNIDTLYMGGGSPGILNSYQIHRIFQGLSNTFDLSQIKECTVELNPEDALPGYLEMLKKNGVNRISIGVQSTHNQYLGLLGRRHSGTEALQAIYNAKQAGFSNISADIMFGIPQLSLGELTETIDKLAESGINHISAYLLTAEGKTLLVRQIAGKQIVLPDDETCRQQYNVLCNASKAHGFDHYEISNFCIPGTHSRHNSAYWNGSAYLGLGPSAHSYNGQKTRRANISDLKMYIEKIRTGKTTYCEENLSETDLINEYIMTRLRTVSGIDVGEFERNFGTLAFRHLLNTSKMRLQQGLLVQNGNRIFISEHHMLISDTIISDLFQ